MGRDWALVRAYIVNGRAPFRVDAIGKSGRRIQRRGAGTQERAEEMARILLETNAEIVSVDISDAQWRVQARLFRDIDGEVHTAVQQGATLDGRNDLWVVAFGRNPKEPWDVEEIAIVEPGTTDIESRAAGIQRAREVLGCNDEVRVARVLPARYIAANLTLWLFSLYNDATDEVVRNTNGTVECTDLVREGMAARRTTSNRSAARLQEQLDNYRGPEAG